jgi:hypothetical protein
MLRLAAHPALFRKKNLHFSKLSNFYGKEIFNKTKQKKNFKM